jgi:hypothetical protein
MCCAFLALVVFGPRIVATFWWLFRPAFWSAAFNGWLGGGLWWIWPVLGIIFVPWLTLMYVIVSPGGVTGWDWLWVGLALVADIASYSGSYYKRSEVPYMSSAA